MAWGWFPETVLFPKVHMLEVGLYTMDYLTPSRSLKSDLDSDEYALYNALKDITDNLKMPKNIHDCYNVLYNALSENLNEFPTERTEILAALDGCATCGADIWMEVSPRNVRCIGGMLCLMDVFFQVSTLREVRKINRK